MTDVTEAHVARSLQTFIGQCNAAWPNRSKTADGTIGDASHASRASGHNPNSRGAICAFDLTNDPANGADCTVVAEQLRLSRDKRIVYVIWNRRIFDGNGGTSPWTWRDYHGTDPHTGHIHMSVGPDVRPWTGGGNFSTYDDPATWHLPVFGLGDDVTKEELQAAIREVLNEELVLAPAESGAKTGTKRSVLGALTQIWGHVLRAERKQ